jgi:hypothetical protein
MRSHGTQKNMYNPLYLSKMKNNTIIRHKRNKSNFMNFRKSKPRKFKISRMSRSPVIFEGKEIKNLNINALNNKRGLSITNSYMNKKGQLKYTKRLNIYPKKN